MNILLEAINKLHKYDDFDLTLSYEDLPVTLRTEYHEPTGPDYWSGGDSGYYDEREETVNYDLDVDGDEVYEVLWELIGDEEINQAKEEGLDLVDSDDDWYKYLLNHFDDLAKKYEDDLKSKFYDRAVEAAEESNQINYDSYDGYDDYDYYEED